MKSIKVLLAAALLSWGASAMAQEASQTEYQFKKHAFINLQGGAQYTLGEAKFGDLISPNVQLGIGYQFNPWFGARLAANAWQSKGGWSGYVNPTTSKAETVTFKYKYVAPGIDFKFNLSNLFCGYNPKRVLNMTAFVGGGANIAWGNDDANNLYNEGYKMRYIWSGTKIRPVGRGGIDLGFRLSDAVSFIVEGNANVMTDHFNSKYGDNPDWYFNALAGFRINLGKTYTKKEQPAPEPEPAPAPVVEEKPAPAPAPVEEKKVEPIRRDVFFTINSTQIRDTEAQKVKEIVDYMNQYPNSKVTVTGYADAGTGNDVINDRISAKRAAKVVNELTAKYGIPADRITSDSKGARVQPFAENDKNRVSICIAE
jgi:OOP family OmpA-OmpF porin